MVPARPLVTIQAEKDPLPKNWGLLGTVVHLDTEEGKVPYLVIERTPQKARMKRVATG